MSRQFKIHASNDVELQLIQIESQHRRRKSVDAVGHEIHMQTMNDDGDIQLVDDIELFSPHEAIDDRYHGQDDDDYEYQTNDLEDSQRIRLIPNKNKQKVADSALLGESQPLYGREPLNLQIKSKLQPKKAMPVFSSSLQPMPKRKKPPI